MGIGTGNGRGGPRANSGGARPNSGPKKKPPTIVRGIDTTDELAFLQGVMANEDLDIKERIGAAKALATAKRAVNKPLGKKEQAKLDAAEEVEAGAFAAGAAPKSPKHLRVA